MCVPAHAAQASRRYGNGGNTATSAVSVFASTMAPSSAEAIAREPCIFQLPPTHLRRMTRSKFTQANEDSQGRRVRANCRSFRQRCSLGFPFALSVASAASEVETHAALRLRPLRAYAQSLLRTRSGGEREFRTRFLPFRLGKMSMTNLPHRRALITGA